MNEPNRTILATGSYFFWEIAKYLFILGVVLAAVASLLLLLQYSVMLGLFLLVTQASVMMMPVIEALAFFAIYSTFSLMFSAGAMSLSGAFAVASYICELGDHFIDWMSRDDSSTPKLGFFDKGSKATSTDSDDPLFDNDGLEVSHGQ